MSRTTIAIAAALALAVTLPAVSAQAQAPRTFVSAAGSDSNPCSFAAPCRHFQAAVNATSAGGEVDALDPAGYGPITISQGVTIEGQGWSYIAPPAGGNGITINAVNGNVAIHGVSLNGAGISGGTNGIVFNSGISLTITDCVVQNFVGNGILIQPTSSFLYNFTITDTIASNNEIGISYKPPSGSPFATVVINRVTANANSNVGIQFNTGLLTSNSAVNVVNVTNSLVSGNNIGGIYVDTLTNLSVLKISIDNVTVIGNSQSDSTGIDIENGPNVVIGRSTVTGHATGVQWAPNTLHSYGNNQINQNFNDFTPAAPPVIPTR